MSMVKKYIMVATHREELSTINLLTPQWGGLVRLRYKLNTLYLHLQNTHGYQTDQGADLLWEFPNFKATWRFGHVINVRSRDSFKDLHFNKTYGF